MHMFDLVAILDGAHTTAPHADLQMLPIDGMTAVMAVTPSPILKLPQSRKQILANMANRLRWQEACLPLGTLLPLCQNSLLTQEGAVHFLIANRPFLDRLMARFAGCVQVQVTVGWRLEAVLDIFRDSHELAPLFSIGRAQPDQLAQAMACLTARLAQQIGDILASASVEIASLPTTESTLWNGALLVRRGEMAWVSAAVEAVDAIWSEGMQIRQIGPAPIGSFATLALETVSVGQIDAACRALGMTTHPQMGDVAQGRRMGLLGAADDMDLREDIRMQARIAAAAARLPGGKGGVTLARLWSEGQASAQSFSREVA